MTTATAPTAPAYDVDELLEPAPDPSKTTDQTVIAIAIDAIAPDPDQPREDADDELAASIAQVGVQQPILVRAHPNAGKPTPERILLEGKVGTFADFMIIDGERRWRGSKKAGRTTIAAIIREGEEVEDRVARLVRQSVSNTGKPLTAREEANAWKEIQDSTGMTIAQLVKLLGRPKSTVSDRIALAEAPEVFRPLFETGAFTAAAAPIARKYAAAPKQLLEKIVDRASQSWDWRQAIIAGKPIPLADIERSLEFCLTSLGVQQVPKTLASYFTGESFELGGKPYTADLKALGNAQERYNKEQEKQAPKTTTADKPHRDPYLDDWQREQTKRRAESARFGRARLAILTAFAKSMQKAATGISGNGKSAIAELVLKECSGQGATKEVLQLMPVGSNAESILRHAAFLCVVDVAANSYLREHHMPRLAKAFGVDIKKILDEVAPLKKPAKKKSAKKAKGR